MTVKEILNMDSTVTVGIGANKLQELLATLKHYAEENEALKRQCVQWSECYNALVLQNGVANKEIERLKQQEFKIRMIDNIDLTGLKG